MIKIVQQLFGKYSSGRNVIILLIATQIFYFTMILYTIPQLMNYADGMNTLDMLPTGYSPEYVKTLLDTLGTVGRDYYLFTQIPIDMIYPFLFAISYSILLTYLFRKSFNHNSKLQYLCLIPLLGGLFDYLENIGIILMISYYPKFSNLLAEVTNVFSILKSVSTTLFFVSLLVGIISITIQKFNQLRRSK